MAAKDNQTRPARFPVIAVLTVMALMAVTGCSPGDDKPVQKSDAITLTKAQRHHIRLYSVALRPYHKSVMADATVDFDQDHATQIISPITGPVIRVIARLGEQIGKGAPLAAVASSDFAAAASGYAKARATAATARRLADMDKDLLTHNGVSQREAAQAQTDAVSADADRDAALQTLVALGADGQTIHDIAQGKPVSRIEAMIRAPMAGTVVERFVTSGQLLQAGTTPTFTVADLSHMWVMARLFGADPQDISVGDTATIATDPGGPGVTGRVGNIGAVVDPDTRSVLVRIVAANPGQVLRKQMYVHVTITARRQSRGLLVPVSTVLRDAENLPFVYVARADGGFARRSVQLGYRDGNWYDITRGLKPGDKVVADGALFLQFMQNQ